MRSCEDPPPAKKTHFPTSLIFGGMYGTPSEILVTDTAVYSTVKTVRTFTQILEWHTQSVSLTRLKSVLTSLHFGKSADTPFPHTVLLVRDTGCATPTQTVR